MDEIFEVDAAAVLCEVSETAVTHWKNKQKQYQRTKMRVLAVKLGEREMAPTSLDRNKA